MKTEEAKTRWCPYMAVLNVIDENCIAEGCMAWRWKEESVLDERCGISNELSVNDGYCGLAGGTGAE